MLARRQMLHYMVAAPLLALQSERTFRAEIVRWGKVIRDANIALQ